MLRVRLFVHVHLLILVYYVFPQLVKRVLIHSLIDLLCMLPQHCVIHLDLDIRLLPFDATKERSVMGQDASLSEVFCKLILIVLYYLYDIYVSTMCIYCDYCVYQYKSTELVSSYTLYTLYIYIHIIIIINISDKQILEYVSLISLSCT